MKQYGIFVMMLCLGYVGCDASREYEYYRDTNLTLTETNHPHGFKETQCFYCHVKENIHQVDRYGNSLFGSAKDMVEGEGLASCSVCHGNNGVQ